MLQLRPATGFRGRGRQIRTPLESGERLVLSCSTSCRRCGVTSTLASDSGGVAGRKKLVDPTGAGFGDLGSGDKPVAPGLGLGFAHREAPLPTPPPASSRQTHQGRVSAANGRRRQACRRSQPWARRLEVKGGVSGGSEGEGGNTHTAPLTRHCSASLCLHDDG